MKKRVPESTVIKLVALIEAKKPGTFLLRMNSGALKDATGRLVRFGATGYPDFAGWRNAWPSRVTARTGLWTLPVPLFVECKASDGKLSPAQIEFLTHAHNHGCECWVARPAQDDSGYTLDKSFLEAPLLPEKLVKYGQRLWRELQAAG